VAKSAEFVVEITANLQAIKAGLRSLQGDINKIKNDAAKPGKGIDLGIDKTKSSIQGAITAVKGLIASYAGLQTVTGLARLADEAATLNARLKLATNSQEELNQAQAGTFDIAQRTRTSVGATIDLYARLERSTRDLGVNQATLLQLTESINQAAQISGGGPGAEAALFQLSQGLASGTLRGEELNSVLEQTPRISQAIADGLGVPIGKLRELAEEGELTAERVGQALLSQKDKIAKEYSALPLTISGAITQLSNAFLKYVGETDKATGSSRQIAEAIKTLADNLPEIINAVVQLTKAWAAYFVLFKALPKLIALSQAGFVALGRSIFLYKKGADAAAASTGMLSTKLGKFQAASVAFIAGWELGTYLRENFASIELAGNFLVEGLLIKWEQLKKGARILVAFFSTAFEDLWNIITFQDREDAASKFKQQMDKIVKESDDAVAAIKENFQSVYDDIEQGGSIAQREAAAAAREAKRLQDELAKQKVGIPDQPDAAPAAGGDEGKENKFNANLRAALDENELLIDSIDRALSELERRYDDNLVSLNDYYAERARLQTQSIDTEIAVKRQELDALKAEEQQLRAEGGDNTGNVEAQSRVLTEIVKLERERAEVAPAAAREQAAAERELADQLLQVKARLAEAAGQTAESRRQQIEAEFAELRANLQSAGDTAGLALVDRLINVEAAKANLDEIEGNISETLGNLRAQEDNITAQIDAGLVGQFRGEEQLQALREKSIEQLKRYKAELEAAYAAAKDPAIQAEISKRITELDTELARVTASTQQLQNQLRDIGQSGLETFFNDVMAGTKSIGDAFRGLILQIAKDIGALAAKNVAGAITGQLSGAFGGGGGGFDFGSLFSKAGSFLSSFFHRGGIVGQGAPVQRMVPAWAFAGAPRYHSGGMAGLKPDEVPAVLQKGEEVLAKDDPRNAANGQQGGFRVVNVLDPKMAGDYLESSEGERVIMNIIGRNPGQVRQLLG